MTLLGRERSAAPSEQRLAARAKARRAVLPELGDPRHRGEPYGARPCSITRCDVTAEARARYTTPSAAGRGRPTGGDLRGAPRARRPLDTWPGDICSGVARPTPRRPLGSEDGGDPSGRIREGARAARSDPRRGQRGVRRAGVLRRVAVEHRHPRGPERAGAAAPLPLQGAPPPRTAAAAATTTTPSASRAPSPTTSAFVDAMLGLCRENQATAGLVRLFTILAGESVDLEHPAHEWMVARYRELRRADRRAARERAGRGPRSAPTSTPRRSRRRSSRCSTGSSCSGCSTPTRSTSRPCSPTSSTACAPRPERPAAQRG